jgi:hypothetical protein
MNSDCFASLISVCRHAQLTHIVPELQKSNCDSVDYLVKAWAEGFNSCVAIKTHRTRLTESILTLIPGTDLPAFVSGATSGTTTEVIATSSKVGSVPAPNTPACRRDFPMIIVAKRGRGSASHALAVTNDTSARIAADASLERDMFAASSVDPRNSLWNTWCKLAQFWDLEPFPLMPELVLAVGAFFKAGGYKSVKNYFSQARQRHVELTSIPVDAGTSLTIKRVERSCLRGLGGSKLNDAFEVELLARTCRPIDISGWVETSKRFSSGNCSDAPKATIPTPIILSPRHLVLMGCWFLKRGIEISAAETKHWSFNLPQKQFSWCSPVSKTDWAAVGDNRTHG